MNSPGEKPPPGSSSSQVSILDSTNDEEEAALALPPTLMRNLGDRSYDKRKSSAMEVENLIKQLQENGNVPRIRAIVKMLGQDFCRSTNANHRKGGLIGLAATAIGLMHKAHLYLDTLLPPVLHCFDDPESRVRYYACESLYNIAKVARGHILRFFNQIFDGLCKLFADVDVDVKNGANLLDRLVKDIVTESESFDIDMFIPLLQKYICMTNPYIRQLLVGWITVLDSVPDIDMVENLPEFLDGLFNMLSDGNREIRQAADSALAEFLREVKQSTYVDLGSMVSILIGQCRSKQRFQRLTAITWVHEFVTLGRERLVPLYADILGAVMFCIGDSEHEIRQVAERANVDLCHLVKDTPGRLDLMALMDKLNLELVSDHVPTRMNALRWIAMLLEKSPEELDQQIQIQALLPTLLRTLSDSSDLVVLLDLEVIARISLNQHVLFHQVLGDILDLFRHDRQLLECRGSLIIRKLCVLLDAKSIYLVLASVLVDDPDNEFVSVMIQNLNLILFTASELLPLRELLQRSFETGVDTNDNVKKESQQQQQQSSSSSSCYEVFEKIYRAWCVNAVATYSLCLFAQAYDLSRALIVDHFATMEVTVGFLMQLDKLVQLLESPVFIKLRLSMLATTEVYHEPLMKSLYGLLMILPQSSAFHTLRDRLTNVTSMTAAISSNPVLAKSTAKGTTKKDRQLTSSEPPYVPLLQEFQRVQAAQHLAYQKRLQAKSLIHDSSTIVSSSSSHDSSNNPRLTSTTNTTTTTQSLGGGV